MNWIDKSDLTKAEQVFMSIPNLCLLCHYEQNPLDLYHGRQFLEESLGSLYSWLSVFGKYDISKQLLWLLVSCELMGLKG